LNDEKGMGTSTETPAWKPLGELLVEQSWITKDELEQALAEQEERGQRLGQIVVDKGLISVEELTEVLLAQCGLDISTQDGFGSGLRDELARRGRRREREPVRFEFATEPEPQQPVKARRAPRLTFSRNPNRKPLKRLEKLVKEFDRQERELLETITTLRRTLAAPE
jgi:hypothetical protein